MADADSAALFMAIERSPCLRIPEDQKTARAALRMIGAMEAGTAYTFAAPPGEQRENRDDDQRR
jgi:hypothetical protein